MTKYNFMIRTLSPLHIGSGEELKLNYDFLNQTSIIKEYKGTGFTWRLNVDEILASRANDRNVTKTPAQLLNPADFVLDSAGNPNRLFRYRIPGEIRAGREYSQLRACVKDPFDCPYVPGSSIKGAIRTALAVQILKAKGADLKSKIKFQSNSKKADDEIEGTLFGPDPNSDWMRAFRISDALLPPENRRPGYGLLVANTNPLTANPNTQKSVPIEIEAIQWGNEFFGFVTVDDFLLGKESFLPAKVHLDRWIPEIHEYGMNRLYLLKDWYSRVPDSQKILKKIDQLIQFGEDVREKNLSMALLQIGFGCGWDGMTYGELLQKDLPWFSHMLKDLKVIKPNKKKSGGGVPSVIQSFPTSRKVVYQNEIPADFLGWCLLDFTEVKS